MSLPQKEIQFHWRLIQGGEPDNNSRARQFDLDSVALPGIKEQVEFSRFAEAAGMESLLTDFSYGKPDSMLLACNIISHVEQMKYLVAIRSGIICPTYFVQQVNTFSALYNGRILLNIVAGHSPDENAYYGDFLAHDLRYDRTEEFLEICNSFWYKDEPVNFKGSYYSVKDGKIRTPFVHNERKAPYTFIAGSSDKAKNLAISHGDCWMRLPDLPHKIKSECKEVLAVGKDVGLRLAILSRDTHEEAMDAGVRLIESVNPDYKEEVKEDKFVRKSDSVMMQKMTKASKEEWLNPWLWTETIKTFGAAAMTMIGSHEEVSDAIIEYKKAGVTQFIFSGWPKQGEMINFGRNVLPLVRKKEKALVTNSIN